MAAYYNENDKFAAAWLRELIKAGLIADGEVDERSIADVAADDVRGFVQCHFFAGIGGWSYALRLAGWPDDREVWTGSCPCQPWSAAGAGLGADDSRDLWPLWFELIRECHTGVVFGEQVAGKAGRAWLDRVFDNLEAHGYAVGPVDLPSCSVGAFDRRQRHWFVADAGSERRERERLRLLARQSQQQSSEARWNGEISDMADTMCATSQRRTGSVSGAEAPSRHAGQFDGRRTDGLGDGGEDRDVADSQINGWGQGRADDEGCSTTTLPQRTGLRPQYDRGRSIMADADVALASDGGLQRSRSELQFDRHAPAGPWDAVEWIECRDGKIRPIEPGLEPLAHGIPARLGRLRGYGNAINPRLAATFIQAYCDARGLPLNGEDHR